MLGHQSLCIVQVVLQAQYFKLCVHQGMPPLLQVLGAAYPSSTFLRQLGSDYFHHASS